MPVADAINSRHERAKAEGWKEKAPGKAAFIQAVLEDNNLLRRPIFLKGKKAAVGWDEKSIRALIG